MSGCKWPCNMWCLLIYRLSFCFSLLPCYYLSVPWNLLLSSLPPVITDHVICLFFVSFVKCLWLRIKQETRLYYSSSWYELLNYFNECIHSWPELMLLFSQEDIWWKLRISVGASNTGIMLNDHKVAQSHWLHLGPNILLIRPGVMSQQSSHNRFLLQMQDFGVFIRPKKTNLCALPVWMTNHLLLLWHTCHLT